MSKLYTWPNPTFPFRFYLNHSKCRIFWIENLSHNYDWLKKVKDDIKDTDFFLVHVGWHFSDYLAKLGKSVIEELGLNIDNFFIMYNSEDEMDTGSRYGFTGSIINQGGFLDENMFSIINCDKIYDALYIARPSAWKRHYLADKIKNLALVCGGGNHGNDECKVPKCKNDSTKHYNRSEIVSIINESSCGLILSETEGASFCSSEYLLCGIPVVSTPSVGGRDYWYTEDNSIIVPPESDAVKEAVSKLKRKKLSPYNIREEYIKKMHVVRTKFIMQLQSIFNRFDVLDIPADTYFNDNFYEKMRKSMNIKDVISIFVNK